MNLKKKLQETYDNRSRSMINNSILWIRWEYYKYIIVPVIKDFIKQTSSDGWSVLYWKIIERGSGQWHKMAKTIEELLGDKFEFIGIEPSGWMRKISEKKFKDDDRVSFVDWFCRKPTHWW